MVTPPDDSTTDTTRATAEALALAILVETMRTGTPSQRLAAALVVHPRARPVDATAPDGTGKATHATITIRSDGEHVWSDGPPGLQ